MRRSKVLRGTGAFHMIHGSHTRTQQHQAQQRVGPREMATTFAACQAVANASQPASTTRAAPRPSVNSADAQLAPSRLHQKHVPVVDASSPQARQASFTLKNVRVRVALAAFAMPIHQIWLGQFREPTVAKLSRNGHGSNNGHHHRRKARAIAICMATTSIGLTVGRLAQQR